MLGRIHAATWLTIGLWVAAVLLNTGILAAHLSATVPPHEESDKESDKESDNESDGESDHRSGDSGPRDAAALLHAQDADTEPARLGSLVEGAAAPAYDFILALKAPEELRLKAPETAPAGTPSRWLEAHPPGAAAHVPEPVPVVHRVRPGETLIRIARGYLGPGADWDALAEANSIEPPYTLQVDREIRITGAGALETRAKVALAPPVEHEAELAARAAFAAEVNPPPARAFRPPEKGLRLRHPVWEAFPWTAPLTAAAVFLAAVTAAGAYALETAPKRMRPRRAAALMAWGAAPAGGMFFLAGGLSVLTAGRMAGALGAELLLGVTAAALTGLVAYFGTCFAARTAPGGGETRAPELAMRFAAGLAALVAGAFVLSALAGWTTPALRSLALPR